MRGTQTSKIPTRVACLLSILCQSRGQKGRPLAGLLPPPPLRKLSNTESNTEAGLLLGFSCYPPIHKTSWLCHCQTNGHILLDLYNLHQSISIYWSIYSYTLSYSLLLRFKNDTFLLIQHVYRHGEKFQV